MIIDFGGQGGETEEHQCERETWIGCLLYVPQLGIELAS